MPRLYARGKILMRRQPSAPFTASLEAVVKKAQTFLVNTHPQHKFAQLPQIPETQLVMLVPWAIWRRLGEYINAYEGVQLAGRFGATPGDYEWEWIPDPAAIRWWRRASTGLEYLWGLAAGVRQGEWVELYGMVEIDETGPFWPEVIPEEVAYALPTQAKLKARQDSRLEEDVLAEMYRDYFRQRGMLLPEQPGQAACRRGTIREVERFRDAILELCQRAATSALPSEVPANKK